MPPGISIWTFAVPGRNCRITTTSSRGVSAMMFTQSGDSITENRCAPTVGCAPSKNAVRNTL